MGVFLMSNHHWKERTFEMKYQTQYSSNSNNNVQQLRKLLRAFWVEPRFKSRRVVLTEKNLHLEIVRLG